MPDSDYCSAHNLFHCSLCSKPKREIEPCCCDAYPFPHRAGSGRCYLREEEYTAQDGRTAEDDRLDDPRHGQSAEINKKPER